MKSDQMTSDVVDVFFFNNLDVYERLHREGRLVCWWSALPLVTKPSLLYLKLHYSPQDSLSLDNSSIWKMEILLVTIEK